MAKPLVIEIRGDPDHFRGSLRSAETATHKFGRALGVGLKTAGIAAAAGIGVAVIGLKKAVDAAKEAEIANAKMRAQLDALKISYEKHAEQIDKTITAHSQLSAFDDEALTESFTRLVRVTGDVDKALNLNALAADIARARNMDLQTAAELVGKVSAGNLGILSRYGIVLGDNATKTEALAMLQEKFRGQAEAYGNTAAGAQERFQVALENLGETVGAKVLPKLTQLMEWVVAHMPQIEATISKAMSVVGKVIDFVVPIVAKLIDWFGRLADFARQHWGEVQEAANRVVAWYRGTLQPAIQNVVTVIQAIWDRFGDTILRIVERTFGAVIAIVRTILGNLSSVIEGVLALFRGDWGKAWDEFKEIPRRTLGLLVTLVKTFVQNLYDAALAIGAAIVDGIKAGVNAGWEALTGWIGKKMADLKYAITHPWEIFSPSRVTIEIGKQIAEGLGVGFDLGTVSLPQQTAARAQAAIDAMIAAVQSKRSAVQSAFSTLTNEALAAFDKLTSEIETKTERKLRVMDERAAARERQRAIDDSARTLADAQAKADAVGPHVMGQAKPEGFDEAQQALLAAQRGHDEALAAQQRFKLEQQAARERKALDDERALKRRHFEEDLRALAVQAERTGMSHEEAHRRIIRIFRRYEIPFRESSLKLGSAVAEGLREAMKDVEDAANALVYAITNRLSNIRVVIGVDVRGSGESDRRPGRRASGGPVAKGVPYLVGERGMELFVPLDPGLIVPNWALNQVLPTMTGSGPGPQPLPAPRGSGRLNIASGGTVAAKLSTGAARGASELPAAAFAFTKALRLPQFTEREIIIPVTVNLDGARVASTVRSHLIREKSSVPKSGVIAGVGRLGLE